MSSVPRISFLGANRAAQTRLRAAFARVERSNERVATGKSYNRPSENEVSAARAALLRDQLDELATFGRAVDDSRSRLATADAVVQQAGNLYHRITELATQAATSTTSPAARSSIADEIHQLQAELVSIANTQYQGKSIFAGLQSGLAVTYDVSTSDWVFNGSATERIRRRIAPGEVIDASMTAGELFSSVGNDIFKTLDDLQSALTGNDTAGIQASLGRVTELRSTLSAGQARLGAMLNRVENAADRNSVGFAAVTSELSQIEDVDLGDAITDQNRLSVAYQAALGVTAKANQQTLLDWWR
ncbi:MAG: hypothetical protein HY826_13590 [Actinobacteria bacterium]|nr:hypothetical protein [Actinomycetota bacterium]